MTSGDQEVSCQGVPYNNGDTLIVGYLCLQEVNGFQFNIDSLNLLKSSVTELLEYTVQSTVLINIIVQY